MPLDYDITEQKKKVDDIEKYLDPLIKRFDEDYLKRYLLEEFKITNDKGAFDSVTSNLSRAEADKLISSLATAEVSVSLSQLGANAPRREKLQETEDCANGFIRMAKQAYTGSSYETDLHSLKSFYQVVRGWTADRLLLYEDDDGNTICDWAVWDIRNTRWIDGKKNPIYVCYISYETKEGIELRYPGCNAKPNSQGFIKVYNVFDCSSPGEEAEEGVFIDKDWVEEPDGIGLDYIPVRIKPGNFSPLINGEITNSIKYVGESCFAPNRGVYDLQSELLTYGKTRAGIESRNTLKQIYDSKQDPVPPEKMNMPIKKGENIPLDAGKGQDIEPLELVGNGDNIDKMTVLTQRLLSIGGVGELVLGLAPYPETAQGTEIIAHMTMSKLKPFQLALERDYEWVASEIVSQYKGGEYSPVEFEASGSKRYKVKAKPDNMITDLPFSCRLIPDILRDKNMLMGIFAQGVQSGAWSRRTGRDECQLVKDPDHEEELISMEMLEGDERLAKLSAAIALIKDAGTDNSAKATLSRIKANILIQEVMSMVQTPQAGNQPGISGVPRAMPPSSTNGAMRNTKVPANVREEVRARG